MTQSGAGWRMQKKELFKGQSFLSLQDFLLIQHSKVGSDKMIEWNEFQV
jgi:hypothetical protein